MKKGTEHNVLVLLRYATNKDITAVFSVYLPRGVLFAIDTAANITVPGFDSCTINFRVKEKIRKEYYVSRSHRKLYEIMPHKTLFFSV